MDIMYIIMHIRTFRHSAVQYDAIRFLIRSYGAGRCSVTVWTSVMITLGPCWRTVKLHWVNIANGSSTIRFYGTENAYLCMAQLNYIGSICVYATSGVAM